MLILTRKKNETIHIGEMIKITVVRISGGKVRIGISAPDEMPVKRIELQTQTGDGYLGRDIDAAA